MIRPYGVIMAAGILACFLLARRFGFKFAIERKTIEDVFPVLVISGFLGARLYHVLFSWEFYRHHLLEIPAVWHGGLAIYGAIIGGGLAVYLYGRFAKLSVLRLAAPIALVLPLGQAIGRWGNYFNQEAFGQPTSLPWGIYIDPTFRPLGFLQFQYFHPTFLYEILWNLFVFALLWSLVFIWRRTDPRFIVGAYLASYSFGRFFIEILRLDSFYLAGFKVDQAIAILGMLAGAYLVQLTFTKPYA